MERTPTKNDQKSKRVQQVQKLPKKKALASSSADSSSNAHCPNPQTGSITSIDEHTSKVSQFFRKRFKEEPSDEIQWHSPFQAKNKIESPPQINLKTFEIEKIEQKDSGI